MRLFLAVACQEQWTRSVATALDALRSGPIGELPIRWTNPEVWHVTLQFLGNWPTDRLEGLQTALDAAREREPFGLIPAGLGGFPKLNRPRVLFLQLNDDGQAADLAGRVREIVRDCWSGGPQDTRPFRCHLTLGRIRERTPVEKFKLLQDMELRDLPPLAVEGFSLVASELRAEGPRHETLAYFPLRK